MSVLVLSFASCSNDDKIDYINHDELPEKVQTLLSEYMPNNKFISASNIGYGAVIYLVQLEGDVKAQFTSEGEWFILESERGLPETTSALLSENSRKQLSEQHATAKVLMMTNHSNDEIEMVLDNSKTYYDLTGHEGKTLAEGWFWDYSGMETLPEKMKEFIGEVIGVPTRADDMKPWYQVFKFSGFKGTIYRFRITPYTFVDFYEDGEWFYMKEDRTHEIIKNTLIKAIPEEVIATLEKKEPNAIATIKKITRFDDNKVYGFNKLYGFDFGDNQFILINSENKVVEPPLDKAKEFIKKGFGLEDGLQYKVNANASSAYFLRYGFIVTGDMGEISLVTDVYGNMRKVAAGPLTTDQAKTIALPRAVIEMLHEDIVSYFDTNFPEGKLIRISYAYSKVGDIPSEVSLMMSIPNNLKTLVFDTESGEFIRDYLTIGGQ